MEIEKLKEKYDFSDGLMSKIEHSIDVLRKGEEFALGFMIRDIILLSVEARIAKLFIM